MDSNRFAIRKHWWRVAMFLPAVSIALAGVYWLRLSYHQIYVGDFSPAGDAFVSYIYNDRADMPLLGTHIRDARTGEVIFDLSPTRWARGNQIHWSLDGNRLVGLAKPLAEEGNYCVVTVEFSPTRRIISSQTIHHDNVQTAFLNPANHLIHIEDYLDAPAGANHFTIVEDNSRILKAVDYGADETVYAYTNRDREIINVVVWPDEKAGPKGDFSFSDGTQPALLQFDSDSGEQLRLVTGKAFRSVTGNSNYVSIRDAKSGMYDVVDLRDETKVLATLLSNKPMVALDDERLLTWDYRGANNQDTVTLHELRSGGTRKFSTEDLEQVARSGDGNAMLATRRGRLIKLDLTTGGTNELANVRLGLELSRAAAVCGIPLFWIGWMILGWRRRPGHPFADMGTLLFVTVAILMLWSAFGASTVPLVRILLATMLPILLIWASTFRSLWGLAMPIGVLGFTIILMMFFALSKAGNPLNVFVAAGAALIFWQTLGLVLLRRRIGILERSDVDSSSSGRQSQVSLLQIMVVIAAFGLLFACFRLIEFKPNDLEPTFLVWLTIFTAMYALAVLASIWSVFCIKNVFLSGFICLLIAVAVSVFGAATYLFARDNLGLHLGQHPDVLYIPPVIASLMVWLLLRYTRGHGYQLRVAARTSLPQQYS